MQKPNSVASVLFRKEGSDEVMSALSIDTTIMGGAPIHESIGVDVYTFDQIALSQLLLFRLYSALKPSFPSLMHFVGIGKESKERQIIFFSNPDEPNNTRLQTHVFS